MSDDVQRLCQWCGGAFRLGSVGRRAVYCRPSCRQRAYEARREAKRIAQAVAAATVSSRDSAVSSRGETEVGQVGGVPAPMLPDPGDGWVRSPDVVEAQLRELEARRSVAPRPAGPGQGGRAERPQQEQLWRLSDLYAGGL